MASPIPPAEIAYIDQAMADSSRQLDVLLAAYHRNVTRQGDTQALANIALALTLGSSREASQSMLLAAVQRLARLEENHGK